MPAAAPFKFDLHGDYGAAGAGVRGENSHGGRRNESDPAAMRLSGRARIGLDADDGVTQRGAARDKASHLFEMLAPIVATHPSQWESWFRDGTWRSLSPANSRVSANSATWAPATVRESARRVPQISGLPPRLNRRAIYSTWRADAGSSGC